jgi:hypothetical protein
MSVAVVDPTARSIAGEAAVKCKLKGETVLTSIGSPLTPFTSRPEACHNAQVPKVVALLHMVALPPRNTTFRLAVVGACVAVAEPRNIIGTELVLVRWTTLNETSARATVLPFSE